jgi:hypothetical protein
LRHLFNIGGQLVEQILQIKTLKKQLNAKPNGCKKFFFAQLQHKQGL